MTGQDTFWNQRGNNISPEATCMQSTSQVKQMLVSRKDSLLKRVLGRRFSKQRVLVTFD